MSDAPVTMLRPVRMPVKFHVFGGIIKSRILLATGLSAAAATALALGAPNAYAEAPAEAGVAACEAVKALATADYERTGEYIDRMLKLSTGELHADMATQTDRYRSALENAHTRASVASIECGRATGDGENAQARVKVTQRISNDGSGGKPFQKQYTMQVDVTNVDGRWLASKIEIV